MKRAPNLPYHGSAVTGHRFASRSLSWSFRRAEFAAVARIGRPSPQGLRAGGAFAVQGVFAFSLPEARGSVSGHGRLFGWTPATAEGTDPDEFRSEVL